MDLEQFQRAYMQTSGMVSKPLNFAKSIGNLASSAIGVITAIGKDAKTQKARSDLFNAALTDLRNNGFSARNIQDVITNRPKAEHTGRAVDRMGNSALGVAKAVNGMEATSAWARDTTVAARRSNSYEGQDMQLGASFVMKAAQTARKGLHLSNSVKGALEFGVVRGLDVMERSSFRGAVGQRSHIIADTLDRGNRTVSRASQDYER